MKELSIEQKAKAYDEAIERANDILKGYNPKEGSKATVNYIFPELHESEDEKIRKELIRAFQSLNTIEVWNGIKRADIITWLEKQGTPNQVSIWKHWKDGIAGNGEGKPIYLVKIGNTYSLTSCLGFECDYIELSELDNLMLEKQGEKKSVECIKFSNGFENQVSNLIASVLNGEHEYNEGFVKYVAQSLLGYAKNELKPTEWTEEDEKMFRSLHNLIYVVRDCDCDSSKKKKLSDWIESLKGRYQSKQEQEWSEEDEIGWTNTMIMIKETASNHYTKDSIKLVIDWLESIKQKIGG